MSDAPRLRVREVRVHEREVTLRLPFRFGSATLTAAPLAFVRARVEAANGAGAWGAAAELLAPKWFDKNPALDNEENFAQLHTALGLAAEAYVHSGTDTAFGLSAGNYRSHLALGRVAGLNALTAGFGPAVLDRAVLDAACRIRGVPFAQAMRANLPGIEPARLVSDLGDLDIDALLAGLAPRDRLHARHTVGLLDPLSGGAHTVRDGLPETLEEVIAVYGQRYFKIKVGGELNADLDRLAGVAAVLDASGVDYRVTLDGNESYPDVDGAIELWRKLGERDDLARLRGAILFVEQPVERARALDGGASLADAGVPFVIDESDDDVDAFLRARERGYRGVSSKGCKGMYKSVLNFARCTRWNREAGAARFVLSGEDLTCQPGVGVQQDLALSALLGIEHVERNGHHYVLGMSGAPPAEQRAFLAAHPDLYRGYRGATCLAIEGGEIRLGSLACPGFACAAEPRWSDMPLAAEFGN